MGLVEIRLTSWSRKLGRGRFLRSRKIASTGSVKQAQGERNTRDHEGELNVDQSGIVEANMPKLLEEKSNHKNEGVVGRNIEK